MFDLRVPSGWFFAITGAILAGMGVFAPDLRAPMTGFNVNLYVGSALLLFVGALLALARKP
jgi:hypothetical protein